MVRYVLLALAAAAAACAGAARNPSSGPLPPGSYTFTGTVTGEHALRSGTTRFPVVIDGTLEVAPDGAISGMSTRGACAGRPAPGGTMLVQCGDAELLLGGRNATLTVPVQEQYERGECELYRTDREGRRHCSRYRWIEDTRRTMRTGRVSVARRSQ